MKTPVKEFLKSFEAYLRGRNCSWNTVSTYMRTLRAVYNRAVDRRIAPYVPHHFRYIRCNASVYCPIVHSSQRTHISRNRIPAKISSTQIRLKTFQKLRSLFSERQIPAFIECDDSTHATPVNMGGPIIPTFP